MAEEKQSLELYGNEYGIDTKHQEFLKIFQKVGEIKDLNDQNYAKNKSTLQAIFFVTDLETLCKVSTSLNRIEKYFLSKDCESTKNNKLNDFICNIKEIHPHLEDVISKETYKIISTIIDDYSFSVRVFYKFEGSFDYFFQTQNNFTLNLKEFMWVLFIQCKCQFLERTRNTLLAIPLLVTIFYMILNDVQEEKLPLSFITEYEKQNISKSSYLLQFLCSKNFLENQQEIINLKDMIKRDLITKSTKLIKSNEMTFSGLSINNQEELHINLTILRNLYGNSIKIDCFDERLFLINNMKDNSPVKLTPFRKQGHHNYYFKKPNCYQKLDFSSTATQSPQDMIVDNNNINTISTSYLNMLNESLKSSTNNNSLNNTFQSMVFNNSSTKNSYSANEFYGLTPCSKIIQMDNWIQKYIKDVSYINLDKLLQIIGKEINFLNEYFDKIMERIDNHLIQCKAKIKNNRTIMNNLFLKFLNDILWFDIDCFKSEIASNLLLNTDLLMALIICTVESILFIENVENVSIFKLIEVVKLDLYDLWKIINPFLKVASINMPPPIITHFSEIEVQIISLMIWSNKNKFFLEIDKFYEFTNKGENKESFFIENDDVEICKKILNEEFSNQTLFVFQNKDQLSHINPDLINTNPNRNINDYKKFNFLYLFLKRILHYCLIFIKKLQQNLNLQSEVALKIINLMKYIIFEETLLFNSRHIDQIILCSCFLIIKQYRAESISFNELLGKRYKAIKQGLSDLEAKSIVSRVLIRNNIYESLIDFYNKTFITMKGIKEFIDDETKGNKKKKILNSINYASILLKDDDYITNPVFKFYRPFSRIFVGGDINRSGVYASPDITGTPRTNRIKNTYSEVSISEMDIKKDHKNVDDFFRNRALLAKSALQSRDTPSKQPGIINEETKNSQSAKSTPEFMKYS